MNMGDNGFKIEQTQVVNPVRRNFGCKPEFKEQYLLKCWVRNAPEAAGPEGARKNKVNKNLQNHLNYATLPCG